MNVSEKYGIYLFFYFFFDECMLATPPTYCLKYNQKQKAQQTAQRYTSGTTFSHTDETIFVKIMPNFADGT